MQHFSTRIRLGGAILLLCLTAPAVFADSVTMRITDNPLTLTPWGSEYVSPYSAQILSGNSWNDLSVVCLDIAVNTYVNAPVVYNRTQNTGDAFVPPTPGPLPPLTPDMQHRYDGAARLAAELLAPSTPVGDARGMRSYAIWYIFNQDALNGFSSSMAAEIRSLAENAVASGTSVSYNVYTAANLDHKLTSQRFIGNVTVPEPSAVAVLGLDMFSLLGLVLVFGRRLNSLEA